MGYIILLGCVAGAIISVYLLTDYINKKLAERETAGKTPEYISPEKEHITQDRINELRKTVIKHYFPTMESDNPEDVFEKLRKYKSAEKEHNLASGGTVTSFNVAGDLFDPPETVVPMSDFLKRMEAAVKSINERKFISPGEYQKGYGGMVYPSDHIPPYLEVSKHYAAQFAGKTIADAAELVGNYGQWEFVKPENVEQFACDFKNGFARAYKIPKGFLESMKEEDERVKK